MDPAQRNHVLETRTTIKSQYLRFAECMARRGKSVRRGTDVLRRLPTEDDSCTHGRRPVVATDAYDDAIACKK